MGGRREDETKIEMRSKEGKRMKCSLAVRENLSRWLHVFTFSFSSSCLCFSPNRFCTLSMVARGGREGGREEVHMDTASNVGYEEKGICA